MNAVASRNVKFISHSDQGGRGDGVQIIVHRGYAYIGHGYSNGITVLDVRDPKNPRPVVFLPCPPDTRAIHLQTHDDLLLAVNGPSIKAVAGFMPEAVPSLLAEDAAAGMFAMDYLSPQSFEVWKAQLQRGHVLPTTAAEVGRRLVPPADPAS